MSTAPAGGRRERTKAENRAAILDAARDVFIELGYGGATIRDIVRRTALATGTFYNYFPDKESVLRALIEDRTLLLRERLSASRRTATTVEEFVGGGFRIFFEFIAEDPALFELMRRNSGTIRTLFDLPALLGVVEELVADQRLLIAGGTVPGGFDVEYMASAMFGAGFELAVRMVSRGRRGDLDVPGAAAFATQLFLGGIDRMTGASAAARTP